MRGPRWSGLAARRLRIMAEPVLTPMRSSVCASACPKRRRGRFQFLVAAMWLFPFAYPSRAAPSKSASVGGLILPQIQRLAAEAGVTIDGKAVACVDIRTGSSFEYRAQHLLSSGVIDQNWIPDSTECCLGSPEGIREHVIPDGAGGAYAAWVDSRLEEPDIYLQRFTACGEAVAGWPSGGSTSARAGASHSFPGRALRTCPCATFSARGFATCTSSSRWRTPCGTTSGT